MTVNLPDDGESEFVTMSRREYLADRHKQFDIGGLVGIVITLVVVYLVFG